MADDGKPVAERSYVMGDVGAGARVAQGENIKWVEGVAGAPGGAELAPQFAALLERIAADPSLDKVTRKITEDKTKALADGLAKAKEAPEALHAAVLDAKGWFGSTATWVGQALGTILKSEAAHKVLGSVTEAATKAVIADFVK